MHSHRQHFAVNTILLVEDDQRLASQWQISLETKNYRVIHEYSADGAIEALSETNVDVVVVDIVLDTAVEAMSLVGGLAVISYVALNVSPRPAIIAVSGNPATSTFVDHTLRKIEGLTTLRKPINDMDMLAAIEALLQPSSHPQIRLC